MVMRSSSLIQKNISFYLRDEVMGKGTPFYIDYIDIRGNAASILSQIPSGPFDRFEVIDI